MYIFLMLHAKKCTNMQEVREVILLHEKHKQDVVCLDYLCIFPKICMFFICMYPCICMSIRRADGGLKQYDAHTL